MSDENICSNDYKRFKKNFDNNTSNVRNQYISNELTSSDLRNKINFKRSQNRNKFDSEWNKQRNDNIVIECQSGECNELEWRKVKIKKKQVFSSHDIELYKEYVQWDFINNKLFAKSGTFVNTVNNEEKLKFINILKYWFSVTNNEFNEVSKYEYYTIVPKIDLEHSATLLLRKELIDNNFVAEKDANEKIRNILDYFKSSNSRVIPHNLTDPLKVEYDSDQNILIVNKFKSTKVHRGKSLSNESEIISAARLLLREECLDSDSRQSGDQKGVRNEAECELREGRDKLELNDRKNKNENWQKESDRNKQRNDRIVKDWQSRERSDAFERGHNKKQPNKDQSGYQRGIQDKSEWKNQRNWNDRIVIDKVIVGRRTAEGREMSEMKLLGGQREVQNKSEQKNQRSRNDKMPIDEIVFERRSQEAREMSGLSVSNTNQSGGQREVSAKLEWRRDAHQPSKENSKEVTQDDSIELYKEYVQWDFINNKLYNKGESLLNLRTNRERQEFTNTLQRWFIFINEDFNEVPKYEYYTILPNIELEHPAAQFLREAIIEKRFASEEDADRKMRNILNLISTSHSEVVPHDLADELYVEHDRDRKIVVVNKFQSPEVPRVNLLVKKGGVIATARMLLRYESFGNGSYQWGDPKEVHKVLHDLFDVRYEGFASPVNSRFIEYGEAHFCSLFPETDEPFGSIGNFFHVDMKQHSGGWSVNPPFLNDLMKNVAIRINKILDEGHKCVFFCTFPWWEDDEGWNILNKSRHFLRRFDLLPQHFTVQDAYGKTFEPNMKMNLFVLGELPTDAKLIELGHILVHDHKGTLPANCPW